MYCKADDIDYDDDDFDSGQCEECSETCEYHPDNQPTKEEKVESELAKEFRAKLVQVFGTNDERIENIINHFITSVQDSLTSQIRTWVTKEVERLWNVRIETETDNYIEKMFQDALQQSVFIKESDSYVQKKCQEIILNKIKDFFQDNYRGDDKRKKLVNESMDGVINNVVDSKVKEALEEIKTEAIDKFNKDVLKKMMSSMCKELASDKRLLSLIG